MKEIAQETRIEALLDGTNKTVFRKGGGSWPFPGELVFAAARLFGCHHLQFGLSRYIGDPRVDYRTVTHNVVFTNQRTRQIFVYLGPDTLLHQGIQQDRIMFRTTGRDSTRTSYEAAPK